jgi:hypothetical protein
MRGTFLIAAQLTTHQEIPGRNLDTGGLIDFLGSLRRAGSTLLVRQGNSREEVPGVRCQVSGVRFKVSGFYWRLATES